METAMTQPQFGGHHWYRKVSHCPLSDVFRVDKIDKFPFLQRAQSQQSQLSLQASEPCNKPRRQLTRPTVFQTQTSSSDPSKRCAKRLFTKWPSPISNSNARRFYTNATIQHEHEWRRPSNPIARISTRPTNAAPISGTHERHFSCRWVLQPTDVGIFVCHLTHGVDAGWIRGDITGGRGCWLWLRRRWRRRLFRVDAPCTTGIPAKLRTIPAFLFPAAATTARVFPTAASTANLFSAAVTASNIRLTAILPVHTASAATDQDTAAIDLPSTAANPKRGRE